MCDMNIISWNVKGLGNSIKRKKILSVLKEDMADVVFLQETYLSDSEHTKLKMDWVGQVYFSSQRDKYFVKQKRTLYIRKNCYRPKW